MKVIFHHDFYQVYVSDPAASKGRMEAVIKALGNKFPIIDAAPAETEDIAAVHSEGHIDNVRRKGLYPIAALAAGGAIQVAALGLREPAFALIRPPGHHASENTSWGFCYFNDMAIALTRLLNAGQVKTAAVLDFDLHYGDGNVNILGSGGAVKLYNPNSSNRAAYLDGVEAFLSENPVDIIGISAGFDNHAEDWGGLLATDDYFTMGQMVKEAARKNEGGYFGILEGGYNHKVIGQNVLALLEGMSK